MGGAPSKDEAARLLANEVEAGRCTLKHWNEDVEQWIIRVNCLAMWCPECGVAAITAEDRRLMIEEICSGAFGIKEVKEREVWPVVKGWLDGRAQSMVEKHVPERVVLPNGRKVKVAYSEKSAPVMAARIQDLYGVESSMRVAMGRQRRRRSCRGVTPSTSGSRGGEGKYSGFRIQNGDLHGGERCFGRLSMTNGAGMATTKRGHPVRKTQWKCISSSTALSDSRFLPRSLAIIVTRVMTAMPMPRYRRPSWLKVATAVLADAEVGDGVAVESF